MGSITAALLLLSSPKAFEEKLPSTMEINAVEEGVEIVLGRLKVTGKSFRLDQAKRTLSVRGDPALLIIQGAPGFKSDTSRIRGPRITINLADGSIAIEDEGPAIQPFPKAKK